MAILVELLPSVSVSWSDDRGDVLWQGYGDLYHRDVDDSGTIYLSLDGQALDHDWKPWIISFSSPSYETAEPYGGHVRMQFGSIVLSPDVFASNWPPPKYAQINVYYTPDTEDEAIKIFEGNIYLDGYDEESTTYNLYHPDYSQNLLRMTSDIAEDGITHLSGEDYNGDDVPLPIAFGSVTHIEPLQLPNDAGSRQTYWLAGIGTSADAKTIVSFTSSGAGAKTKVVTSVAHGWSDEASITINGSTKFNGTHTIENASGSEFVIPVEFPTDNSERLPITAHAFIYGSFQVYEDGVPIDSNVIVNGDGTFSLSARADKTVTISGTGQYSSLSDIMEWATSQIGVNTFNDDVGRTTSPTVAYYADKQQPIIDFMSDLCAFFTHYFYIKSDILYLCDMLKDNGSETLDEYEYFKCNYSAPDAVSQITSEWQTWEAANGVTDDGTRDYKYIKTVDNKATVTGSYQWGNEMDITPYSDVRAVIETALTNILTIMNRDFAEINIPLDEYLPDPGKKLTFSDSKMVNTTNTYIWARRLQFDFENDEILVSGDGVIA